MAKTEEPTKSRVIAEWVGDATHPVMQGSARELSKKDVKESLVMELTRDLRWGPESRHRADVSDESSEFIQWLKDEPEFKVTET